MKLAKVISDYVQLKQGMGMRFKSDSVILKAFIKASGDLDIADIQKNTVALFLAGKGPLTSFWHRKFQALNGLYRFAIGREYVSSSPLPKITPKQPSSFTPYIYSSEELRRLLEATSILESSKGDVDTRAIAF